MDLSAEVRDVKQASHDVYVKIDLEAYSGFYMPGAVVSKVEMRGPARRLCGKKVSSGWLIACHHYAALPNQKASDHEGGSSDET